MTFCLSIFDDAQRSPVLHAAAWIEKLSLGQYLAASFFAKGANPQQRSIADSSCESIANLDASLKRLPTQDMGNKQKEIRHMKSKEQGQKCTLWMRRD